MNKNTKAELSRITFIEPEALFNNVKAVLDTAKKSLIDAEKNFHKNSVDPFSALFDASWQNIPISEWIKQESSRQNQKTLQNALGNFHQNILGSMNGWENLTTRKVVDVKNSEKKIIAEVKNKYNTTKGNHKMNIYDDFQELLNNEYKGYTAYYVEVIPKSKKTYNKPFTPSDNRTHTKRPINESIRVIDGKSFYALASGDEEALKKIYLALPTIIGEVLGEQPSNLTNSDFEDLYNKIY